MEGGFGVDAKKTNVEKVSTETQKKVKRNQSALHHQNPICRKDVFNESRVEAGVLSSHFSH